MLALVGMNMVRVQRTLERDKGVVMQPSVLEVL